MRGRTYLCALVLGIALALGSSTRAQPVELEWQDAPQLVSPEPVVWTEWRDSPSLLLQSNFDQWVMRLTVDETGAVTHVLVDNGPMAHSSEAIGLAGGLRFAPVESGGQRVAATFPLLITGRPRDYSGPTDRTFPVVDAGDVRIRLQRTGCFGSCPSYSITVSGDGRVTYTGEADVLVRGAHTWSIPRADVEALLRLFRQADYFNLAGYYMVDASDLPTYITGLDIGPRHKFVLNYGWSGMGEAVASTSTRSSQGPAMPPIVSEIEREIDRLSGATAWVRGDQRTLGFLRADGFSFSSAEGGLALAQLVADCRLDLARAFLAEGARAHGGHETQGRRTPPVLLVPRCGDPTFAQALVERGALRRRGVADEFLHAAAASGYPEMVRIALAHSQAVNQRAEYGETLLMLAAEAIPPDPEYGDDRPRTGFDPAESVALLLQAGANARLADDDGDGPLHRASDAATVRLLLAAGANPNARNTTYGRTALFGAFDAGTVQALIDGAADIRLRDNADATALFQVGSGEVVPILVAAGLDVNDRNREGLTPLDVAGSEEIASALIEAGARLPTDPDRMARVLRRARHGEWNNLLPLFEAHARSLAELGEAQ